MELTPTFLQRASDRNPSNRVGLPAIPYERYPTAEWATQEALYAEYWEHYSGQWLYEMYNAGDAQVEMYPLKYNLYEMAVALHVSFLFGEVPDNDEPLVRLNVSIAGKKTRDANGNLVPSQESLKTAALLEEYLNDVWYESNGRAIQQEAGIMAQVLGGAVFGAYYDPNYTTGVRIQHHQADYFYPVYNPADYFDLIEAIVAYKIGALQAESMYGVKSDVDEVLYHEHWRKGSYEVTIDGENATYGGYAIKGNGPGFVPFVYIPHPQRVGGFYGTSLLKDKFGLAKEVNQKMSDMGDILAQDARRVTMVSGATNFTPRRIGHTYNVIDLGLGLAGHDIKVFSDSGTSSSQAAVSYVSDLLSEARLQAYTPSVLYGSNEFTQRSALTLAMMCLPMISHTRQERTYWTTGLSKFAKHILYIAAQHNIRGITKEMVDRAHVYCDWAPSLPRDAEQELNQIILQVNNKLMSPETAMKALGEIRDISQEVNLIKAWTGQFKGFEGSGGFGENSQAPKEPQAEPINNQA